MTNWYKKKERKEVLLSCHERKKKRGKILSSPEEENLTPSDSAPGHSTTISIKSNCYENTLYSICEMGNKQESK